MEIRQAAGGTGIQWLKDLCNDVVKEACIPDDWQKSVMLPIYKWKGDVMDCS